MKIGLNVPTTYRIGRDLLQSIADFGFEMVRVDVPPAAGDLYAFVRDYVDAPVVPLFLLHDVALNEPLLDNALSALGPSGFWLQVFNEPPSIGDRVNLQQYITGILAVHHDARARGFTGPILMGGLANPGQANRDWLASALEQMPPDVLVDEHRYAYKTQDDWDRPWPEYTSRANEISTLRVLAGGRGVTRTEIGWHTAKERIGWGPFGHTIQLTDAQATENLVKDLILHAQSGVEAVFVYQLNDGPQDGFLDKYGIRRLDGSWKPQAECVHLYQQRMT